MNEISGSTVITSFILRKMVYDSFIKNYKKIHYIISEMSENEYRNRIIKQLNKGI